MCQPETHIFFSGPTSKTRLEHKKSGIRFPKVQTRVFRDILTTILQRLHSGLFEQLLQGPIAREGSKSHSVAKNINGDNIL